MTVGAPTAGDESSVRITFLGHGAERTGPPILLGHLLRGLARSRPWHRSVLVARGGPLMEAYRSSGATALAVTDSREPLEPLAAGLRRLGLERLGTAAQRAQVNRVVHRLDAPDLVYVNAATPPTAALLRVLDPPPEVPVIVHVHELDLGLRYTLSDHDRRLLFGRADRFITVSQAVTDVLVQRHQVPPSTIDRCEGFIDVASIRPRDRADARRELAIPEGALVIGSVGLPDARKDPDHLLRSIAAMPTDAPPPWIVWVGGAPASPDGRRMAAEADRLGLGDRMVHVPHLDDPWDLLLALDIFALPAREDAMPLAALEAGAAGLPIVCYRTGGTADLCDRGAGIAVPYPDTIAFAAALADLARDPAKRAAIGARAREIVRSDHDLDGGTQRIAAVIDAVLAGHQHRSP